MTAGWFQERRLHFNDTINWLEEGSAVEPSHRLDLFTIMGLMAINLSELDPRVVYAIFEACTKLIESDPEPPPSAYLLRGRVPLELNNVVVAVRDFQAAVASHDSAVMYAAKKTTSLGMSTGGGRAG